MQTSNRRHQILENIVSYTEQIILRLEPLVTRPADIDSGMRNSLVVEASHTNSMANKLSAGPSCFLRSLNDANVTL
jgi:hypothetical protein